MSAVVLDHSEAQFVLDALVALPVAELSPHYVARLSKLKHAFLWAATEPLVYWIEPKPRGAFRCVRCAKVSPERGDLTLDQFAVFFAAEQALHRRCQEREG